MQYFIRIFSLLVAFAAQTAALGAASISAELQPSEIALGESANLIVSLSGVENAVRPVVPGVDGLQISPSGQSSQIRIVNGQMSSSVRYSFRVSSNSEGDFEIPQITASAGGQLLKSEPLKLRVVASSATARGTLSPNAATTEVIAPDDLAFLRIERASEVDREHLYVGEMMPVAIRAYFPKDVQVTLNSKPELLSPEFTLHSVSEDPAQSTILIDGEPYRMLTWYAGLSGVKAGDYPLKATVNATIGIPKKQRRGSRSGLRSPFDNDPFFDGFFDNFFTRVDKRDVTLKSEDIAVDVQPLPSEGRPSHFDGAVGTFQLGSFSIPADMQTGDPATMRVTVSGKGNFDRVSIPKLQPTDGWKTYTAKDTSDPADTVGFHSKKIFEIPVIALEPGNREVKFSLAYFDPEMGEYLTAETAPVPVTISGNAIAATSLEESPIVTPTVLSPDGIAPLRDTPGYFRSFTPLYRRPWFITVQGGVGLSLLAAVSILLVRRYRERHPEIARRRTLEGSIREQLRLADAARLRQDGKAFFGAARRALQIHLAAKWRCNPDAITGEDVAQRLSSSSEVRRIIALADEVEYSGARPDADSLEKWQRDLESALSADASSPSEHPHADTLKHWGEVELFLNPHDSRNPTPSR